MGEEEEIASRIFKHLGVEPYNVSHPIPITMINRIIIGRATEGEIAHEIQAETDKMFRNTMHPDHVRRMPVERRYDMWFAVQGGKFSDLDLKKIGAGLKEVHKSNPDKALGLVDVMAETFRVHGPRLVPQVMDTQIKHLTGHPL